MADQVQDTPKSRDERVLFLQNAIGRELESARNDVAQYHAYLTHLAKSGNFPEELDGPADLLHRVHGLALSQFSRLLDGTQKNCLRARSAVEDQSETDHSQSAQSSDVDATPTWRHTWDDEGPLWRRSCIANFIYDQNPPGVAEAVLIPEVGAKSASLATVSKGVEAMSVAWQELEYLRSTLTGLTSHQDVNDQSLSEKDTFKACHKILTDEMRKSLSRVNTVCYALRVAQRIEDDSPYADMLSSHVAVSPELFGAWVSEHDKLAEHENLAEKWSMAFPCNMMTVSDVIEQMRTSANTGESD